MQESKYPKSFPMYPKCEGGNLNPECEGTSESCVLYVVSYDGTKKLMNPVYCTLCPMMGQHAQ